MGRKRGRPRKGMDGGFRGESSSSRVPQTIFLDDETWVLRRSNISVFDPYSEYEGKHGLFTIIVHHGGIFHNGLYVQGRVNFIDECSVSSFNLFELSSVMVALGYSRDYICEWYYCDPENNIHCVGKEIGHPTHPLFDDIHMERFLSLLGGRWKEVHVYCLEITHVEAIVRLKEDEEKNLDVLYTVKSTVVIEEIEEAPKPKPRPRSKNKIKPLMLCWYERDVEFEEFLETSLEEDRKRRKKLEEDGLSIEIAADLIGRFNDAGGSKEGVVEGGAVEEPVVEEEVVVEEEEVVKGVAMDGGVVEGGAMEESIMDGGVVEEEVVVEEEAVVEEEVVLEEEAVVEEVAVDGGGVEGGAMEESVMDGGVVEEEAVVHADVVEEVTVSLDDEISNEYDMAEAAKIRKERGKSPALEDDVYMPDFDEVFMGDDCPLHNEGSNEHDEEFEQFISLVNMCRDEQLFASYFDSLGGGTHPSTSEFTKQADEEQVGLETGSQSEPARERQRPRVVEVRQRAHDENVNAEILQDAPAAELNNEGNSDDEVEGRRVVYHTFTLTMNVHSGVLATCFVIESFSVKYCSSMQL